MTRRPPFYPVPEPRPAWPKAQQMLPWTPCQKRNWPGNWGGLDEMRKLIFCVSDCAYGHNPSGDIEDTFSAACFEAKEYLRRYQGMKARQKAQPPLTEREERMLWA